jgi:endonuclease/exonuclease/phosphatase family metal-dependent hydrolase
LRVATFNIKHAATAGGYLGRPRLLGQVCAEIDADILALQEVDRFVWRSWFADLSSRAQGTTYGGGVFAKAMGANVVSLINPGGQYGIALLVKGEILSHETVPLTGDHVRLPFGKRRNVAPEPRIAMFNGVRLENGLTVSTGNTHIGGPKRADFLRTVATRLTQLPGPHVLLGDDNATHGEVHTWLSEVSSLQLAPRPPELANGYRQSDHIAVDGLEVTSVSAYWTRISDHPVVLAELREPSQVTDSSAG